MDAIAKLTPEQRQAVMHQAQQEANAQVMREMIAKMANSCFQKCAGTSVRCITSCYIDSWRTLVLVYRNVYSFLSKNNIHLIPVHRYHSQGDRLDSREQACMAACQDRYLETRQQVQEALTRRQSEL